MALSEADERRVEAEVARMVEELRNRPSQEKEDRIGVEIATLPEAERDFVPTALLRFVAAERDGGELPDPSESGPRASSRSRAWVNPLRFRRAWKEAEAARGGDATTGNAPPLGGPDGGGASSREVSPPDDPANRDAPR